MIPIIILTILIVVFAIAAFCVFFDQAILTRRGTIFRVPTHEKKVAITFDDGPSPVWTPQVLDELKSADVKATFFLIGHHVKKYPKIARRIAEEGHTIGNHTYAHCVMLYYKEPEIEAEIRYAEQVIREATGQTTQFFRPPKAWIRHSIKDKIKSLGYEIVLWSLNSKDWVNFNHRKIVQYISRKVKPGDILLFHDSGNVFSTEGGARRQTVKSIGLLARTLRAQGFEIVPLEELIDSKIKTPAVN
jgi:peptidoglycan/xylan/chitin deacetylase (PgdA/CDA1 family)